MLQATVDAIIAPTMPIVDTPTLNNIVCTTLPCRLQYAAGCACVLP